MNLGFNPRISLMGLSTTCNNIVHTGVRKVVVPTKLTQVKSINGFPAWRNNSKVSRLSLSKPLRVKTFDSTFRSTITHVVLLSTNKEVVRTNTGRIVTMMADIQGLIKRTMTVFIHNTMCFFLNSYLFTSKLHDTIAAMILPTGPNPTRFGLANMSLKPLLNRYFFNHKNHI